jgi:hypothetical protein
MGDPNFQLYWHATPADVLTTDFNKPESLIHTFPRKDVVIFAK